MFSLGDVGFNAFAFKSFCGFSGFSARLGPAGEQLVAAALGCAINRKSREE